MRLGSNFQRDPYEHLPFTAKSSSWFLPIGSSDLSIFATCGVAYWSRFSLLIIPVSQSTSIPPSAATPHSGSYPVKIERGRFFISSISARDNLPIQSRQQRPIRFHAFPEVSQPQILVRAM